MVSILLTACDSESPVTVASIPVFSTSEFSGGETTIFDASSHAFSIPAPNLSTAALEKHLNGDVEFEAVFVTAPAVVNPGLGPIYNNVSCINCHSRDGRGRPPRCQRRSLFPYFSDSVSQRQRIQQSECLQHRCLVLVGSLTTAQLSMQTRKGKSRLTIPNRR